MDYSFLIKKCNKLSDFSEPILSNIMYYSADRNKLSQRFDLLAKRHRWFVEVQKCCGVIMVDQMA
nr:hypothetical protein [Algoriphagus sp. Y33]